MDVLPNVWLKAKHAYSTRRVNFAHARRLVNGGVKPKAGDLVLADVTQLGHHDGLEDVHGRRQSLYVGDQIVVCFGNRYAPDQFEAVVPDQLGDCQLVAAGGIAADALTWHANMRKPTEIRPIGLVADIADKPINIFNYGIPAGRKESRIPVILSLGTSMNSGKTTSAARLIKGIAGAGIRVAGIKATGTSAGKDPWLMKDSGATIALDFNDAGFATTYLEDIERVEDGFFRLLSTAEDAGCAVAVVEIADGLLQRETQALLQREKMKSRVTSVMFSAVDSCGASWGAAVLKSSGYQIAALAGVMTNSPLAAREAATMSGQRVVKLSELQDPNVVLELFEFLADLPRDYDAGAGFRVAAGY